MFSIRHTSPLCSKSGSWAGGAKCSCLLYTSGKRYIRKARQKTEVESLIPLHPIAEQILALYTKENSKGDYKIFPDTMSKGKLLTHLKAVGLACGIRTPVSYTHLDVYKRQV